MRGQALGQHFAFKRVLAGGERIGHAFAQRVAAAGAAVGETCWRMPLGEAYDKTARRFDRQTGGAVFRSPIHLIGQSRGTIVTSELAQR